MTIPKSYREAVSFLNGRESKKIPGKRATEVARGTGEIHYLYYHNVPVVSFYPDGTLILNNGGFMTRTTKTRMNQVLGSYGQVFQKKGEWFFRTAQGNRIIPYENEMRINKLDAFL